MTTIEPTKVTDYDRSESELQAFWLFCLFAAGKNSDAVSLNHAKFMHSAGLGKDTSPFDCMRALSDDELHNPLVVNKIGQYTRLTNAIRDSLALDLRTCTLEDLMKVRGAGPKTCRFFLLHTRPDCDLVVLDTHILRWLRYRGFAAPYTTPSSAKVYEELSSVAATLMRLHYPGCSPAQADLLIWTIMSGRTDGSCELRNQNRYKDFCEV